MPTKNTKAMRSRWTKWKSVYFNQLEVELPKSCKLNSQWSFLTGSKLIRHLQVLYKILIEFFQKVECAMFISFYHKRLILGYKP